MSSLLTPQQVLEQGLTTLNLVLTEEQCQKLISYLSLLSKWNKAYNLTALIDPVEMVTKHLLDSLAVGSFLPSGRILDVGCGAGLPSIPLAILNPHAQFVGIDSQQKKINFVLQAILTLKISNLSAVCSRVETFALDETHTGYDGILSRAFASLFEFVSLSKRLLKSTGFLYAMKAKISPEELAALPEGCTIERVEDIRVPGLEAKRCLVIVKAQI